jgi:hypothetical protein
VAAGIVALAERVRAGAQDVREQRRDADASTVRIPRQIAAIAAEARPTKPETPPRLSQAERLVVEPVPAAARVVGKKPKLKFNPSVDRAVE